MGSEYKRTCDELKRAQGQVGKWRAYDNKQRVTKKKRFQNLKNDRDANANVSCCPEANILMLPGFLCYFLFLVFFPLAGINGSEKRSHINQKNNGQKPEGSGQSQCEAWGRSGQGAARLH
jgi:hypothetical protein